MSEPPERSGPLLWSQQTEWWQYQVYPDSPGNNISIRVPLPPGLTPASVEGAVAAVVARHEGLRTTLPADQDGEPRQLVHRPGPIPVPWVRVDDANESESAMVAAEHAAFDVATGPVVRALVVANDSEPGAAGPEATLVLVTSHAVADGWSIRTLHSELVELLDAYHAGRPERPAPRPAPQPLDLAARQRSADGVGTAAMALAHWDGVLASAPSANIDRLLPARIAFRAFTLTAPAEGLRALAGATRTTTTGAFNAVVRLAFSAVARNPCTLIRSTYAGRATRDTHGLVADLQRALPTVVDAQPGITFADFARTVQRTHIKAYCNGDVDPMALRELEARHVRTRGRFLRYGAIVNFTDLSSDGIGGPIEHAGPPIDAGQPAVYAAPQVSPEPDRLGIDFSINAYLGPADLRVEAVVNESALNTGDTVRMLRALHAALRLAPAHPNVTLADLAVATAATEDRRALATAPGPIPTGGTRALTDLLSNHPAVAAAHAATEAGGVVAFVAPAPGTSLTPADIREHTLASVSPAADIVCPCHIVVVATLPKASDDPDAWRRMAARHSGDGRAAPPRPPRTDVEHALARALALFLPSTAPGDLDMRASYLEGGARLLHAPAFVTRLTAAGYHGLQPDDAVLPASLAALAARAARAAL